MTVLDIRVIPTRGVLNPLRHVPEEKMDQSIGINMLNAADAAIAKSRFFEKQWRRNQSAWKPLDPEYVQQKVEAGLSPQKWKLSGDSLRALSTPVMVNASNMYGRTSRLVFNTGYAAECVWLIGYPAASGWPGDKQNRSYFAGNQAIRPWLFELNKTTKKQCEREMVRAVRPFWRRMMIRYFSVTR